jgi:hypothetical protein
LPAVPKPDSEAARAPITEPLTVSRHFDRVPAVLLLLSLSDNLIQLRRILEFWDREMNISINQETVNDAAKLMMHRLISRQMGRDPSLIERARILHSQIGLRYAGRPFVQEWDELLKLSPTELRPRLTSRESKMVRLRLSSPFVFAAGIDFKDYNFRLRLRRAAKRVVERGLMRDNRSASPAA